MIELAIPNLSGEGLAVTRSGFTLLRRDGDRVRKGEPIAFCAVIVFARGGDALPVPIADQVDQYVVVLAPRSGQVHWASDISIGGWRDWLAIGSELRWNESFSIGAINPDTYADEEVLPEDRRVVMCSGRRMAISSDVRGGLLPGWYQKVQGWNFADISRELVVATTCQLRPAILGNYRAFHELLTSSVAPLHVTYLSDSPLVPSASTITEGLIRDSQTQAAILGALKRWLANLAGSDCHVSAANISFLMGHYGGVSVLEEPVTVLQREGVKTLQGARSVLLSVDSEGGDTYQHRDLPFRLSLSPYLYPTAGSDFRRILAEEFIQLPKLDVDELADQYRALSSELSKRGVRLRVANTITIERGTPLLMPAATRSVENTSSYRARVLNDMLYKLADERVLTVLDVDCLSASIGTINIPDGAHGNQYFTQAATKLLAQSLVD